MREWLRKRRIAKGLTLSELASQVGVSWQSISYYENGERRPAPDTAITIGGILDFDWKRFYEEERKDGKEHERETDS